MRYLNLGSTGLNVSEVGFGAIPIIRLEPAAAVAVLHQALARGINFFDTAHLYMDSEEKIGAAFDGQRRQVILATKTMKRDGPGATEDLELSLRRLRTDYLDLYQLHMVNQESDWEAITSPDGALAAVRRAQEQGKIRHIGVTSHSLEMALKLVRSKIFATIQFPFNFVEEAAAAELHPLARKQGLGILAMKPFGGGLIDDAQVAFRYLRQFPDIIPLVGCDTVARVDQVADFYDRENVVTPADLAVMARYRTELGQKFCRRCEYCQPCAQGVKITPAMLYGIVAHRMGPAKAAVFAAAAMETVRNCIECAECAARCPYSLPIPEMLKENLARYEKDRLHVTETGST